jgi:hypothetical protein
VRLHAAVSAFQSEIEALEADVDVVALCKARELPETSGQS